MEIQLACTICYTPVTYLVSAENWTIKCKYMYQILNNINDNLNVNHYRDVQEVQKLVSTQV